MKIIHSAVVVFALMMAALSAPVVFAEPAAAANQDLSAHQVVEQTTERMMKIIAEARVYYDKTPQRFFNEIETVLVDVVDFDSFARGVMGEYASKSGYMALTSAKDKKAYLARMDRFSKTFKDGLVQTYAKGLLAFNGNKIEILPAAEDEDLSGDSSVTVIQNIYGEAESPYVVHYKLRQNRDGEWKLRNVTIEAINLGKVYQSQFAAAAKQYNGDIDRVIDSWTVDPGADDTMNKTTAYVEDGGPG